ncbi:hypothetical protein ACFC6L_16340 [Kitasatospora phosalacinea]|uniref:hypothetical protein n=1 Tax=Kitasatospora phosalacinea TaxID=2065 RepID=UPI0035DCEA0F
MLYTGQSLEVVEALRGFLREGFADSEQAAGLLDPPPEFGGVALGCPGLPWVQRLAEPLLELAFLRGELGLSAQVRP